ncbi:hypothetical protein PAPYR_13478 [Paratrimastix pyriformis]|uniref:Uncharacterized protein n=1 Tax=Paratrimastix pyriformis TaxID=342808 RepID=A0ABQ8U508_9EUKA|nr:hypothetical protein PAPYR_13478 [Paratrimastix pyriformis]
MRAIPLISGPRDLLRAAGPLFECLYSGSNPRGSTLEGILRLLGPIMATLADAVIPELRRDLADQVYLQLLSGPTRSRSRSPSPLAPPVLSPWSDGGRTLWNFVAEDGGLFETDFGTLKQFFMDPDLETGAPLGVDPAHGEELKRQQEQIKEAFELFATEPTALLCETFKFIRLKLSCGPEDIRGLVDDALHYMDEVDYLKQDQAGISPDVVEAVSFEDVCCFDCSRRYYLS